MRCALCGCECVIGEDERRFCPDIPCALLGFGPNFLMPDLPPTSVRHAEAARQAALDAGLRNVRIGNRHLLGRDY